MTTGVFSSRSGYPGGYFVEVSMPLSQFDERVIAFSCNKQTVGMGPTDISLFNPTTYGTRVDQLLCSWHGTLPFEFDVAIQDGFSDEAVIGTVTIPGTTGTVSNTVDVILALFPAIQPFIMLNPAGILLVRTKITIGGTDVFSVYASGGNF